MITAMAAAAFTRESYYGEDIRKNAEGFFGIDAQFFKLYSPKFDIVNQFVFLPNFQRGAGRMSQLEAPHRDSQGLLRHADLLRQLRQQASIRNGYGERLRLYHWPQLVLKEVNTAGRGFSRIFTDINR
jgi:hypothetical protein